MDDPILSMAPTDPAVDAAVDTLLDLQMLPPKDNADLLHLRDVARELGLTVGDVMHRMYCRRISKAHPEAEHFNSLAIFCCCTGPEITGEPNRSPSTLLPERFNGLLLALDQSLGAVTEVEIDCHIVSLLSENQLNSLLDSLERQTRLQSLKIAVHDGAQFFEGKLSNIIDRNYPQLTKLAIRLDPRRVEADFLAKLSTALHNHYGGLENFVMVLGRSAVVDNSGPRDLGCLCRALGRLPKLTQVGFAKRERNSTACITSPGSLLDPSDSNIGLLRSNVTILDLRGVSMEAPAYNELASVLVVGTDKQCTIKYLALPCHPILRLQESLVEVFRALKENKSVETFVTASTLPSETPAVEACYEAIADMVQVNQTMKSLWMSRIPRSDDALPVLRSLKTSSSKALKQVAFLNIGGITEAFQVALDEALAQNKVLSDFLLHVKSLRGSIGLSMPFGNFFRGNNQVKLRLKGWSFRSIHDLDSFVSSLRTSNYKLQKLRLEKCNLQDQHLEQLAKIFDATQSCSLLRNLDLSRNGDLTSSGIITFLCETLTNKRKLLCQSWQENESGVDLSIYSRLRKLSFGQVRSAMDVKVLEVATGLMKNNFVLCDLGIDKSRSDLDKRPYFLNLAMYQTLNLKIPKRDLLEENTAKVMDWVDALAAVGNNLHCVHYLVSLQPATLCDFVLCPSTGLQQASRKRKAGEM